MFYPTGKRRFPRRPPGSPAHLPRRSHRMLSGSYTYLFLRSAKASVKLYPFMPFMHTVIYPSVSAKKFFELHVQIRSVNLEKCRHVHTLFLTEHMKLHIVIKLQVAVVPNIVSFLLPWLFSLLRSRICMTVPVFRGSHAEPFLEVAV